MNTNDIKLSNPFNTRTVSNFEICMHSYKRNENVKMKAVWRMTCLTNTQKEYINSFISVCRNDCFRLLSSMMPISSCSAWLKFHIHRKWVKLTRRWNSFSKSKENARIIILNGVQWWNYASLNNCTYRASSKTKVNWKNLLWRAIILKKYFPHHHRGISALTLTHIARSWAETHSRVHMHPQR